MLEFVLFWVLVAGVVAASVAHVWLLVRAFRTTWWWGLLVLLLPPASLVFIIVHFKRARAPLALLGLGIVLAGGAIGINRGIEGLVGFRPREKIVDVKVGDETVQELHITLTGSSERDYTKLRGKSNVEVLQMANEDVTDDTLENLRGFAQLKELDLNDTQVTDAGLAVLADLPKLATLRLRGTKITDAGFREKLMPKESLIELDLRKTAVERATVGEWRKAQEGRKALR